MPSGTVSEYDDFSASEDAMALDTAMKGAGTDEKEILDILTKRSASQRQDIEKKYKAMFGESLFERLEADLSGDFLECCLSSFSDKDHVDARACYRAMKGLGTKEDILIDVICSCSNEQMGALSYAYKKVLNYMGEDGMRGSLEKDIVKETSGDLQKVLLALLTCYRESEVEEDSVSDDVESLFTKGEGKRGTSETTFIRILCCRSFEHIHKINEEYQEKHGKTLEEILDAELSGDLKRALQTIVRRAEDEVYAQSEIAHACIKGAGTSDNNLIRLILSRSEEDLADIKDMYEETYEKTLFDAIKEDTSGDYRKFLLKIINADSDDEE